MAAAAREGEQRGLGFDWCAVGKVVFLYDFTSHNLVARMSPYGKWGQPPAFAGMSFYDKWVQGSREGHPEARIPQPAKGGTVAPAALACDSPLSCCGLAWLVPR